jgi:hypothetical protein
MTLVSIWIFGTSIAALVMMYRLLRKRTDFLTPQQQMLSCSSRWFRGCRIISGEWMHLLTAIGLVRLDGELKGLSLK